MYLLGEKKPKSAITLQPLLAEVKHNHHLAAVQCCNGTFGCWQLCGCYFDHQNHQNITADQVQPPHQRLVTNTSQERFKNWTRSLWPGLQTPLTKSAVASMGFHRTLIDHTTCSTRSTAKVLAPGPTGPRQGSPVHVLTGGFSAVAGWWKSKRTMLMFAKQRTTVLRKVDFFTAPSSTKNKQVI